MSDDLRDLINRMLVRNPDQRISMQAVLQHCWFTSSNEAPAGLIREEMSTRVQASSAEAGTGRLEGELRHARTYGTAVPRRRDADRNYTFLNFGIARDDFACTTVFFKLLDFLQRRDRELRLTPDHSALKLRGETKCAIMDEVFGSFTEQFSAVVCPCLPTVPLVRLDEAQRPPGVSSEPGGCLPAAAGGHGH